jgi:hypothetical protein
LIAPFEKIRGRQIAGLCLPMVEPDYSTIQPGTWHINLLYIHTHFLLTRKKTRAGSPGTAAPMVNPMML